MAKKKKSNLLRNLTILTAILIVAVLIARSAGWIGKEKITEVFTDKAKKADIIEKVTSSGKIQPETEVKISPDVSGEIVDVYVKEGDSVVKGQLLLRIRPDNLQAVVSGSQANFNSVKANLAQSQAQLMQRQADAARLKAEAARSKQLYDQKVISETDYLLAKTNYEVAKQQVVAAEKTIDAARYNLEGSQSTLNQSLDNLSRTEVYAPVSGTISKLSVEKGEKVVGTAQMAGTEMLIVANLNNMEVQVDVNENDIVRVKKDQKVIIEVDSYLSSNRKFEGTVTEIANTANASTSADAVTEFKVKIRILNESFKDLVPKNSNLSPFRPGMTASVDIITEEKKNILTVPISAVTTRTVASKNEVKKVSNTEDTAIKKGEKLRQVVFVFDAKTGKVIEKEVETGISDIENIEIKKGISDGDEVVIGPFNLLSKTLTNEQKVQKGDKNKVKK